MTAPKDRGRIKKAARYVAVVVLMAISIVPAAVLVPVMGLINLLFLLALWVLLFVAARKLPRRFAILLSVVFALAVTFPPVHSYVSILGERPHFYFIGFEHMFGGSVWSLVYPFVFNLVIFTSVIFLVRHNAVRRNP